jgi:hypothetical protein
MLGNTISRMFATALFGLFLLASITVSTSPIYAQVSGATLSGVITDASGGVVPNAQITIKNFDTAEERTIAADSSGRYSAPNLLPDKYEVTVTASGFSTQVRKGITLTVGAQQGLNFTMQVGEVTQQVEVTGEAPAIELTSSMIGGVVTQSTVVELPLNGRDWTSLATLQPGVTSLSSIQASTSAGDRINRGFGTAIAISGSRPLMNNYRIDGITVNDYNNGGPGSVEGSTLGVDAIQEFSVLTSNYPAEYGRSAGGVINAITKSGTNSFHGNVYEFLRNSALDARNYFDPPKIPEFRRNQFGGSFGGRIRKDRMFFFVDYEGLRQFEGVSALATVPSPALRSGLFNNNGTIVNYAALNPAAFALVQPYFALWRLPDAGLTSSGNTGHLRVTGNQTITENFGTARLDYKISKNDAAFGSMEYDPAEFNVPDALDNVLTFRRTGRVFAAIEETHVFSPQVVNAFRIGYSRSTISTGGVSALNPASAIGTLGLLPGQDNPQITVPGLKTIPPGLNVQGGNFYTHNSFQEDDDVFWTHGINSFKFGAAVEQVQLNDLQIQGPGGIYSFGSITNFLQDVPLSLRANLPGNISAPFYYRTKIFGFYVQDDIRLKPNLTINVGMRYEISNGINEKNGRLSAVYSPADPTVHSQSPWFNNNTHRNFEPRLGFAWDPFRDGKTSVRGGFAIVDFLPLVNIPLSFGSALFPFYRQGTLTGLSQGDFPTAAFNKLSTITNPPVEVAYVEQNPRRSYVQQWTLSLQREVAPNLSAMLAYVGSHGVHLPFKSDSVNDVPPTLTSAGWLFPSPIGSGTPIGPTFGKIVEVAFSNYGLYHALEAQLTKRMSHGFQIQGSYTWSRAIDEGDGISQSDPYLSSIADLFGFDPHYGKGPADFNVTHNLTINYIWSIPTPNSWHGAAARVAGGWQLGGIFQANTGLPFTPLVAGDPMGTKAGTDAIAYPNRLSGAGCESLGNPGDVNNYIKLQCFGLAQSTPAIAAQCVPFGPLDGSPAISGTCSNLLGNGGRNEIYGPGFWNLDFSLFKNTQIKENLNVQFRVEFFNVLNHPTFQAPIDNSAVFNEDGTPVSGAGAIDTTAHQNRQIQFALKFVF